MQTFPINLEKLATPRDDLLKFHLGEIDEQHLQIAIQNRFDHAPVVDDKDRLVGVIPISIVSERFNSGTAIESTDTNLFVQNLDDISPIQTFLEAIAENRAIVIRDSDGQHDSTWYALVTISDLNKHHFRSHIYPILAGLEATLADFIDGYFTNSSDWILKCSEKQQVQHFGQWRVASENGVDTSPIISCTLADLITILTETPELVSRFGYATKSQFKDRFGSIALLRNQIMHPIRPLILNVEDVSKLRNRISAAIEMTSISERLLLERAAGHRLGSAEAN